VLIMRVPAEVELLSRAATVRPKRQRPVRQPGMLAMRFIVHFCLAGTTFALAASSLAHAADVDFSGRWSVSGHIRSSNAFFLVAPVCTFQQTGDQVTGTCKGPNGSGSATGIAAGSNISFQWHMVATNAIGLNGLSTFRGELGRDKIIRGVWEFSGAPGLHGQFSAQKL
jgi:hypothetical protein